MTGRCGGWGGFVAITIAGIIIFLIGVAAGAVIF
jgi:hypothetical protein